MGETAYLQLPLKEMVDLVIAPNEGVVNFNILHNILLVLVQQMNIEGLNVEIHGPQAEKLLALSNCKMTRPDINIKKVLIPPDKAAGRREEELVVIQGSGITDVESVAITKNHIDQLTKEVEEVKKKVTAIADMPSNLDLIDATRGDNEKPIISALQLITLSRRLDATEEGVSKLGAIVEDYIKNKSTAPTKEKRRTKRDEADATESVEEEATKSQSKKTRSDKPKVEKSSSGAKKDKNKYQPETEKKSQADELTQEDATTDDQATTTGSKPKVEKKQASDTDSEGTAEGAAEGAEEKLTSSLTKVDSKAGRTSRSESEYVVEEITRSEKEKKKKPKKPKPNENFISDNPTMGDLINELSDLKAKVDEIWESIPKPTEDKPEVVNLGDLFRDVTELKEKFLKRRSSEVDGGDMNEPELSALPPDIQLVMIEDRFQEYASQIRRMDITFNDEISKLHNQFTDIEKDFNEILLKIQTGMPGGDTDEPNQCCTAVYQKMLHLEAELHELVAMSDKLLDDRDEKEKRINEMLENIEHLKAVKADKEDIEEALADKADACAVHRKVSHDKFDTACDELAKGIEDALDKLTQQETLWQHALDEIQIEIGSKLDKMDLGPLREFINNKLRILQERMKTLAALKKEQEAAGTKSKFLRNVNCISCDKDVVMRKENDVSMRPPPRFVPPTKTMGPYLAYELDALRKQQKSIPGSKNLVQLENAMGIIRGGKREEDHVCNRYCGGSHTITTAQQRVTRLGHFLMQWGPEAVPATDFKEEEKQPPSAEQSVQKKTSQPAPAVSAQQRSSKTGMRSSVVKVPATRETKSPSKGSIKQSTSRGGSITGTFSSEKKISRSSLKNVSIQDHRDIENKIIEETPEQLAKVSFTSEFEQPPAEIKEEAPPSEKEEVRTIIEETVEDEGAEDNEEEAPE